MLTWKEMVAKGLCCYFMTNNTKLEATYLEPLCVNPVETSTRRIRTNTRAAGHGRKEKCTDFVKISCIDGAKKGRIAIAQGFEDQWKAMPENLRNCEDDEGSSSRLKLGRCRKKCKSLEVDRCLLDLRKRKRHWMSRSREMME